MHEMPHMMHETAQAPLRVGTAGWCEIVEDVRPHQHATWELVYFLEGNARCIIGDRVLEAAPGLAVLTPPHTVHYELPLPTFACLYIGLEASPQQPWPRIYRDDPNQTMRHLLGILVREWNGREVDRDRMVSLLVYQVDTLLRRRYVHHQLAPAERLVRAVEQRLEEGFAKPVSIKEIAREVGVSHSFLRAQFRRLRGRTPMAYLQALRVQHAITLIRNSDRGLEAIASLCGYDSASHLSRHVKRATGNSPGSFRTVVVGPGARPGWDRARTDETPPLEKHAPWQSP
jgi:AraC-like DNA-binding protein/mannose-6-phosphate isomerase-like protein (cupin superfamily)